MLEFLGIDKTLQCIQIEAQNYAGKLSELDKHLDCERKKLNEIKEDPNNDDNFKDPIRD